MSDVYINRLLEGSNPSQSTESFHKETNIIESDRNSENARNGDIEKGDNAIPYVGMEYSTQDEAFNFYNRYAKRRGFGVRKGDVDRSRRTNEIIRRVFLCNKAGHKDLKDKRQKGKVVIRKADIRVGCMARMVICINHSSKRWVVRTFDDNHEHAFTSPSKARKQRSNNQYHLPEECQKFMTNLNGRELGPCISQRDSDATDGLEEIVTPLRCHDALMVLPKNSICSEYVPIIHHFQSKRINDEDFYFAIQVEDDMTLRSVFWADGRSRENYRKFGDVVVFDVTYKSNNLRLPFVVFTGVNHHKQSTLFGCALLADEYMSTFKWLFNEWLKCMHGISPDAIITDQDGVVCEAIKTMFPQARHRYCQWHIAKHASEHLAILRNHHKTIFNEYNSWYWSDTVEEFEDRWSNLKNKYSLDDKCWLAMQYSKKNHWAPAFLKSSFYAGMTTTKDSFFDGYVNAQTTVSDFVRQYDNALVNRRAFELNEDCRTITSVPVILSGHPIETQATRLYTRKIFDEFQIEFKDKDKCEHRKESKDMGLSIVSYKVGLIDEDENKWKTVTYDASKEEATCSCSKFEAEGILCKHILRIMVCKRQLQGIPNCYILKRWTIDARHQTFRNNGMVGNTNCENQISVLEHLALKSKTSKALEAANSSHVLHDKLDTMLSSFLIEAENHKR